MHDPSDRSRAHIAGLKNVFGKLSCGCQEGQTFLSDPASVLLKLTVGNFALWADSIVVAGLTFYGAGAFRSVLEAKDGNRLPLVFQVHLL